LGSSINVNFESNMQNINRATFGLTGFINNVVEKEESGRISLERASIKSGSGGPFSDDKTAFRPVVLSDSSPRLSTLTIETHTIPLPLPEIKETTDR